VRIQVNGQDREVPHGITIAELLDELQMNVAHVAVEVNLEVVPRARHARHELHESDRLEVVSLVGGG
jgi:thiamine biosynthesis protein ThiS